MSFKSNLPCVACGLNKENMVTYHHIHTQKSRPDLRNNPFNLISVCQRHHNDFHSKGTDYMANKFPSVKEWLIKNNWYKCELTNKWRLDLTKTLN